jgi:hypothetical protein
MEDFDEPRVRRTVAHLLTAFLEGRFTAAERLSAEDLVGQYRFADQLLSSDLRVGLDLVERIVFGRRV